VRKILLLTAALCLVMAGSAWAFHDGGVAYCGGCHTMHNSQHNAPVDADHPAGNGYLLNDESASDVCLNCHGDTHGGEFAGDPLNPAAQHGAGSFIFLIEDNINDGHGGASNPILGEEAGHSIVAPGRSLGVDTKNTTAPGGTFNSAWLGCTSCHDPHGNESFRMLHGVGPIQDNLYIFTAAAPEAVGNSYNAVEAPDLHTAYHSGMSQWCANCHGDFHNTSYPSVLKHPTGVSIGVQIAAAYNAYNGTSDISGGSQATAYLPEVPFEDADDVTYTTTSTVGPTSSSKVMCLTCHRAHASSAQDAGRWDFHITGLAEDGHESGSYAIPNPYDGYQRSLCNKCHVKDVDDELEDFTPAP